MYRDRVTSSVATVIPKQDTPMQGGCMSLSCCRRTGQWNLVCQCPRVVVWHWHNVTSVLEVPYRLCSLPISSLYCVLTWRPASGIVLQLYLAHSGSQQNHWTWKWRPLFLRVVKKQWVPALLSVQCCFHVKLCERFEFWTSLSEMKGEQNWF